MMQTQLFKTTGRNVGRILAVGFLSFVALAFFGESRCAADPALQRERTAKPDSVRKVMEDELDAVSLAKQNRVAKHPKLAERLESRLLKAWQQTATEGVQASKRTLSAAGGRLQGDDVIVMVECGPAADLPAVAAAITAKNGQVIRVGDAHVKAAVPLSALENVASLPGVLFVRTPLLKRALGMVQTEGHRVTEATNWHAAGFTGQGVKIAVIDTAFAGLDERKADGEIPSSAIEMDMSGTGMTSGESKHGTACAEIVYDMAPGCQLYLIKALDLSDDEAAKNYCKAQGIKIVSYSTGYDAVNFNDGVAYNSIVPHPVSIVNDAVDNGILWVVAAGNERLQHAMTSWRDGNANGALDWTPSSSGYYSINEIWNGGEAIPAGTQIDATLTWSEWPVTDQDFDLYLYRWDGLDWVTVAASDETQDGTTAPREAISYTVSVPGDYGFRVVKYRATRSPKFILRAYPYDLYHFGYDNYRTPVPGSISCPGDAAAALTVGAIDYVKYANGPTETFSSIGPNNGAATGKPVVIKPDICAPDFVSTATSGEDGFVGTSASTPHIAGMAALVKGIYPTFTAAQIRNYIETNGYDLGATGKDNEYGSGVARMPTLITAQPSNLAKPVNASATFAVTAYGAAPLKYQWRKNGVNITGATASAYAITNVQTSHAGVYSAVITNSFGKTTSSNAVLTVVVPPAITLQPVSKTVLAGSGVSFTISASGTAPLSYQWRQDGTNLAGATGSAYVIPNAQTNHTGIYSVVVTNLAGMATSSNAVLTVNVPVRITTHPVSRTNATGTNVTFTVAATGTGPLGYRWFFNNSFLPGATNASLVLTNAAVARSGVYKVTVSNRVGVVTSSNAVLTVQEPPAITQPPRSNSVVLGANVNLSVAATGTALRYQWRKDGTNILGATASTLSFVGRLLTHAGLYQVTVSNLVGSVTSAAAPVFIVPPPPVVLSPLASEYTNAALTVQLQTVTNAGITQVLYSLNGTNVQFATRSNASSPRWTATIELPAGTNLFTTVASNAHGLSPVGGRYYFLARPARLTIETNGFGSVQGVGTVITNGSRLLIGRHYTVQATPRPQNIFSNWTSFATGSTNTNTSTSATVMFRMETNLTLRAAFVTNVFPPLAGDYHGLFYPTNGVAHERSGFFKLTLTPDTSAAGHGFSGKIALAGGETSFTGKFNAAGQATFVLLRVGQSPLLLDLALNFTNATLTGQIHDGTNWVAELAADRAHFSAARPATNYAGQYTLLLPGGTNLASGAWGDGYGLVTVATNGTVTLSGATGDGAPLAATTPLSRQGQCPLYVKMYDGKGLLLGWLNFTNTPPKTVAGNLSWIKKTVTSGMHRSGLTNDLALAGSAYLRPATGQRALALTNGFATLSGGDLTTPLTNAVFWNTNNLLTVTGTNKLALTVQTTSGLVTGSFLHKGKTLAVKGVVLQNENRAAGYFPGTNHSGKISITR